MFLELDNNPVKTVKVGFQENGNGNKRLASSI